MSNIVDRTEVELFVNGEQAEKAMDRLKKKADELAVEIEKARNAGDKKEVSRLENELKRVNKELNRTESAAKGTGIVLNDLSNASMHGLQNALKYLQKELRKTKPNTDQWREYADQIELVKGRIAELNEELESNQSLWSNFKGWAEKSWAAIDIIARGYDSAVETISEFVDEFAAMDQEMANVRKFTGMTVAQVAELNEAFKEIDTRTSREDLNKLAQEAGRLGKTSKEDVLAFVKAADKINVALDDLGDGATLTLSKLTGIFGDEDKYGTEQSLLKVGSVINELSQNCAASAPYLADFASRMGGVGAQANMTIPQIMAFGAVLDSNEQAVEASATALSQVIVRMMQEPAKYAKVAGLDVKKFSDMLKTDVNGALILFLETLQKAGGMDVLSPMFKDMGENGSRAISALSTLATNIEDVKAQQIEANKAFREGISIDNEFEVQNTTLQASLEKAQKRFQELRLELGEYLAPLMTHLISSTSAMTKALLTVINFISENIRTIVAISAATASYIAIMKVHALWIDRIALKTMLANKWSKIWAVTQKALGGVFATLKLGAAALTNGYLYLKNGMQVTYSMQERWRKSMQAMNFGSWTGLVLTLATAVYLLYSRFKELEEEQKVIEKIKGKAIEKVGEERVAIDLLVAAAENETLSLEERRKAIAKLNDIIPDYNAKLDETTGKYTSNKKALDDYIASLTKKYELEGAKETLAGLGKEKAETKIRIKNAEKNVEKQQKRFDKDKNIPQINSSAPMAKLAADNLARAKNELSKAESQMSRIEEKEKAILAAYGVDLQKYAANNEGPKTNPVPPTPPVPPGGEYVSQAELKKQERERKKAEAEARRQAAKEKKEFKETLNGYKAEKMEADRVVLEEYRAGTIDYETMIRRRHENEDEYYEKSLTHFETVFADQKDTYLQDDKDYQKLLLDKEKADQKYEETRISLALQRIERTKSAEEKAAQLEYDTKEDPAIEDEIHLQAQLYAIRREALADKLALYKEGSKEYADIQYEMEKLAEDRIMEQKRLYFEAAKKLREKYDQKSAAERFKLEKATLDAMLNLHIISAEKYAEYLKKLTAEYQKELPGDYRTEDEKENDKYMKDVQTLNEALKSELVLQADFYKRMAKLDEDYYKKKIERFKSSGGEWNAMLADVGVSFFNLYRKISMSGGNVLEDIANCTSTVSSAVMAGMQIASQFAQAEADIQTKAIEKRYDREIELAQGNSYKVAKLEKKKEEETAKVKNKATKKQYQMQVIQAIAQSIAAGLNAYASALAIPIIGNAIAPAAMAVALAMGATQVALLKKQEQAALANGYSKGGFTKPGPVDEPAGVVHAGEWVASHRLLASPVARPMIEALDYAQRTNTIGSLRADDVSRSIAANSSLVRIAESDKGSAAIVAAAMRLAASADSMTSRLSEPFVTVATVTGDKGINRAQDDYARMMNNVTPKSKRKR